MITRLAFLGWIIGLSTVSAADSPRLVFDRDTGISIRQGFDAELLYEVPKSQGSWVAMAFDPKGRLIVSDQDDKGAFRVTLPAGGAGIKVESLPGFPYEPVDWGKRKVGGAYGFLWAFDSLYMANMRGFYRIRDILVAICEPSASISEQYMASIVKLKDGDPLYGRLIFRNDKEVGVASNPFDLNQITKAPAEQVQGVSFSQVSIMPEGMISGLNRDEWMDLMAYLPSGGDSQHKAFKKE